MNPITFRKQVLMHGITLVLVGLIVFVSTSFASTPPPQPATLSEGQTVTLNQQLAANTTTVSYQGHLADANGTPVNSTLPMSFALYTTPTGGEPIWTEERSGSNAVPVTNGLFHVMLGSVEPLSTDMFAQELWLGISVESDSEMTPRETLGNIPMVKNSDQPVLTLLGEKTCTTCGGTTQQEPSGWMPMMGNNVDDPIEVTVETAGGPVFVHMTGSFSTSPEVAKFCAIQVENPEDGTEVEFVHVAGDRTPMADYYCSGSYLFTDLPAGQYTFAAYGHIGGAADEVGWGGQRQIAVYEFKSPDVK